MNNTSITFPPFPPSLKLAKRSSEQTPATAQPPGVQPAQAAPAECEPKLLEHEQRLSALQAEIDALRAAPPPTAETAPTPGTSAPFYQRPGTSAPFQSDGAVHVAWDQIRSARALLEAEQKNLRDERKSLQALEAEVKRREATVAGREQAVAEREARMAAATQPSPDAASESDDSAVSRLTRAPFAIARSVFGPKK